jgi:hypothetical protein
VIDWAPSARDDLSKFADKFQKLQHLHLVNFLAFQAAQLVYSVIIQFAVQRFLQEMQAAYQSLASGVALINQACGMLSTQPTIPLLLSYPNPPGTTADPSLSLALLETLVLRRFP